jgi:hypothetical protein
MGRAQNSTIGSSRGTTRSGADVRGSVGQPHAAEVPYEPSGLVEEPGVSLR